MTRTVEITVRTVGHYAGAYAEIRDARTGHLIESMDTQYIDHAGAPREGEHEALCRVVERAGRARARALGLRIAPRDL